MRPNFFPLTLTDLRPGDHLCCLYETEEEHRAVLLPFLRQGLERDEKVIYIVEAHTAETVLDYLRADGVTVDSHLERGQLHILTRNETYLRQGVFDPEGMIALIRGETERALAEGYPALRVTGEMTWALGGLAGSERLIEYEAKLNDFFPGSKCLAVCQYDRRRFDPAVLLDVLHTHPIAVIGTEVYENSYYVPPSAFLENRPGARLHQWAQALKERKRAERALRTVNRGLRVLSECNQRLVRATTEAELLDDVCRILVETGGYRLAWVGFAEEDEGKAVRPVARRGFDDGYLDTAKITWADTDRGRGPTGTAIRTGRSAIARNILTDPQFAPWRADAAKRGYASAIALPLPDAERTLGALSVYAAAIDAFDTVEVGLLTELANDLAYGILALRTRAAREQAEARLRLQGAALQAAANAILITDRAGRIAWVNPAFSHLTGYLAEEIVGQTPRLFKSGRENPTVYRALWQTILRGEVWRGELWNRRKNGGMYLEGQTITPVRDEYGEISHFIAIKQDITDRKRAEEALATRTLQLEAVRAVTTEITRELDLGALLTLISRRAADLGGASAGAVYLWDEAAQVLVPRAWHGVGAWMAGVRLRPGEGVAGTVAQHRQGMIVNDFRASSHAHPLFLEHTGLTAVLGEPLWYRDRFLGVITIGRQTSGQGFTERDRELLVLFAAQAAIVLANARLYEELRLAGLHLEAEVEDRTRDLQRALRQIEAASRHKSEFLANMSHELRTPLNSILGFSQFLLEQTKDVLSEKQTRYLTHIHTSGQHLLQLINDILDLSRVEAGRIPLQLEPLPIAQTLEAILVIARGLTNKKAQEIQTDIELDLPPLRADPVRFKQICFNLLSNAVKFTPERGRITIGARRAPGEATLLEFRVTDTGVGIKPEDLPRLFQKFVQLGTSQAQRQEGTGLGLALTKRLVELHGGRIWAASEGEGEGSTFTILLPFGGPGDGSNASVEGSPPAAGPPIGGGGA
ncbi:MAG: MEDS domain-containing protein [candidate division NC10 bacterium]|nr:MEDS domain-containing protein [candidate division NC10 bacterium]